MKLGVKVGGAYVGIHGDQGPLKKDLASAKGMVTRAVDDMEKKAARMAWRGLKVGAVVAAGAAAAGLYKAVDAASDLEETVSKANNIFKSSAGTISAWSADAALGFGMSQQAALDAAATMGNMFDQLGAGSDVAAKNSMAMVELAADLASFHNVAGGGVEVLVAMQSAFRGEYDALQRYIPTIKAASVEQTALAMTGKKTAKDLTELEKAQAALTIITKDAGASAGDFGRTSKELANQKRILTAQILDEAAAIGEHLNPVATDIVRLTNDWLAANKGLIAQNVAGTVDDLSAAIKNIKIIYDALPPGIVGPAGFGLVGTALMGLKAGSAIAMFGVLVTQLEKLEGQLSRLAGLPGPTGLIQSYKELNQSMRNIGDVFSGRRNWHTGAFQTNAGLPADATAGLDAFYGYGLASPSGQDITSTDQKMLDTISEQFISIEDEHRDWLARQLEVQAEFTQSYADMNKSRFDLERDEIDRMKEIYAAAGVDRVDLAAWEANQLKTISKEERMSLAGGGRAPSGQDITSTDQKMLDTISEQFISIEDEHRDWLARQLEVQAEFTQSYADMNKSRFDLERDEIDRMKEIYAAAGVDRVDLAAWEANQLKTISKEERMSRLSDMQSLAGGMSDGFQMIAEQQGKYSKEAFFLFKQFKTMETIISTYSGAVKAYESLAPIPIVGPGLGMAAAATFTAFGLAQVAMIQGMNAPSYDSGGVSSARGVYQTGDIDEAHIPLKSGKVPVALSGGGGGVNGNVVVIQLTNPVFQDMATQTRTMTQIATLVAEKVSPVAVVKSYRNRGAVHKMMRGGY